jgi:GNAT superfamily N-acetyltransferase
VTPLFEGEGIAAFELDHGDLDPLQRVYEATPSYFHAVLGEAPGPNSARETFERRPPPEMTFTRKRVLGFRAREADLVAVADVIEDLLAPHVWHVGLFLVSEPLHGSGIAQRAYGELESWMRGQGAHWLRLGAVAGNDRAERFWRRQGYVETRRRSGVAMGRKVNELIVMVKPIAGGSLEEYLALVPGDRAATPARD